MAKLLPLLLAAALLVTYPTDGPARSGAPRATLTPAPLPTAAPITERPVNEFDGIGYPAPVDSAAWLKAACGYIPDYHGPWYVVDPYTGEQLPCPDDATPTPMPPTPTPGPLVPRQYAPVVLRGPVPPPPVWRAWAPVVFVRAGPDVPR